MKMSHSQAGKLGAEAARELVKKAYQDRIAQYNINPKKCNCCGVLLPYSKRMNKYCSKRCSVTINNKTPKRKRAKELNKYCIVCSNAVGRGKKYCSKVCHSSDKWTTFKKEVEKTGKCTQARAKKFITEKDGHLCKICGIVEWQSIKLVMVLDHIDGNSDNWRVDNLRLICPNCDSQTATYKGRNIGKGRFSRRQRYKEGKSY